MTVRSALVALLLIGGCRSRSGAPHPSPLSAIEKSGKPIKIEAQPNTVAPSHDSVGLLIDLTAHDVLLYSRSGLEGTHDRPKLRLSRDALDGKTLQTTLEQIVARRWPDPQRRAPATKQLTIVAPPDVPYELVVRLMDLARASGTPSVDLFPDVTLAVPTT